MPANVDVETYGKLPRQFGVYIAPMGESGNLLVLPRDLTREQRLEKMRSINRMNDTIPTCRVTGDITVAIRIASGLERIGDHATNIADNVYYLVNGKVLREGRPKKDLTSVTPYSLLNEE